MTNLSLFKDVAILAHPNARNSHPDYTPTELKWLDEYSFQVEQTNTSFAGIAKLAVIPKKRHTRPFTHYFCAVLSEQNGQVSIFFQYLNQNVRIMKCSDNLNYRNIPIRLGSASRTRTCDKVINSHLLYQLSYCGSPKVNGGLLAEF